MTKIFLSCTISVGLAPLANYCVREGGAWERKIKNAPQAMIGARARGRRR